MKCYCHSMLSMSVLLVRQRKFIVACCANWHALCSDVVVSFIADNASLLVVRDRLDATRLAKCVLLYFCCNHMLAIGHKFQ